MAGASLWADPWANLQIVIDGVSRLELGDVPELTVHHVCVKQILRSKERASGCGPMYGAPPARWTTVRSRRVTELERYAISGHVRVAVLSYTMWQTHYGERRDVIGSPLETGLVSSQQNRRRAWFGTLLQHMTETGEERHDHRIWRDPARQRLSDRP